MSELEPNRMKPSPTDTYPLPRTRGQEPSETPEQAPSHVPPALPNKEERFRSLAMALATGQIVWITDPQGKVLEAPDWLAFTGQTGEEVDAGNWLTYIHPEDQARVASAWTQAAGSRSRFDAEYRLRKYDGSYEHFEVHGVPVFHSDGSVREWVGASVNVTSQKQAEATVERLRERLHRSRLEMDHRVKNNLQIISALVETQVTDDSETTLQRISQYTTALASLHDLLAIATKESGTETDALSMRAVLARLTPLLQVRAGERHIAYQVEDVLSPVRLIASLAILINELVVNAIEHGEGEIELTFIVTSERGRLEVCDDGPGFPPDFEPRQAAKTGLELVHSTARHDLQGEVAFTNRPDGGARVVVKFPFPQIVA